MNMRQTREDDNKLELQIKQNSDDKKIQLLFFLFLLQVSGRISMSFWHLNIAKQLSWTSCSLPMTMKPSKMGSGPGCSKLTTSLVNVSFKFQTLISEICLYFLLKKCEKLLKCKSFSYFFNEKYRCFWL